MSRSEDRNLLPLLVMLESVGKIEAYVANFDNPVSFFRFDDQSKFNASLLLLLNIGEQANRVSDVIKNRHASVPFDKIRALRNRIAHDYTGIDYEMVFDIIKSDIIKLKDLLTALISKETSMGTFDVNEIHAATLSEFYSHIDFSKLIPDN